MKTKLRYVLSISMLLITGLIFGQKQNSIWTSSSVGKIKNEDKLERNSQPKLHKIYQLDIEALRSSLVNVPDRNTSSSSDVVVSFPNHEGEFESFEVFEASNMDPLLQAQFPEIRAYLGRSLENPTSIIRFSLSPEKGLSTMLLNEEKTVFIEPYTRDLSNYIVYVNSIGDRINSTFECLTDDSGIDFDLEEVQNNFNTANRNADDGQLRTFRLALACTGEYAQYHGGTVNAALAAMNTTMTRVNGVYNRDMAIQMNIIANNNLIIYLDGGTDPYTNNSGGTMLGENQTNINSVIGSANYDIGHVFSTGGGGIAQLNSPCTSNKARGVTGQAAPVGDFFDIDYVAHEMGHQYGATHTQNNNCQISTISSMEPGSASTIMGYAGICAPNVQSNSDDYFHTISILQMWNNVSAGSSQCGAQSSTGNSAPVANAGSDYIIPKSTAFILKGTATDANVGDALTYCWEQYDNEQATMPPVSTSTLGPAYRSLNPTSSPNRYMPALSTVLGGSLQSTWEVTPSVARAMDFVLTVRDNATGGASTHTDIMTVNVNGTAGPFTVTSQASSGIIWNQGNTETITWNVAGTTGNGINTSNVNILLSTDGGLNFDTVLVANTPNDGTEDIVVPNMPAPYCRIMVEPVGNIYYAVNSQPFSIDYEVTTTCTQYASGAINLAIPDGAGANVQGTPVFNTLNVPDSYTIESMKLNVDVSHTYIGDLIIQLQHPNGTDFTNVWARTCNDAQYNSFDVIFEDGAPDISCSSPTTGNYAPANPLSVFTGLDTAGDWVIVAVDFYNQDTGTLNDWYMEFCTTTETQLSVDDNEIFNFTLFPNPNSGVFTIKFPTLSNQGDVNVSVFDIRGRQVFKNIYTSNGSEFNETINLGQLESGMYMVNVTDGNRKITKKIIVE